MRMFADRHLGRCALVRFSERHLTERYVGWLNDPETVRYSEQRHRKHTRESCAGYFHAMRASSDLFLAIEAYDPALGHIGNISISFDDFNKSADVSIMIGEPAARGGGFATLAWNAAVETILETEGLRRVTAGTMATNEPMIALMKRSGMTIDAIRPRAFLLEGAEVDLVLASKFVQSPRMQEPMR